MRRENPSYSQCIEASNDFVRILQIGNRKSTSGPWGVGRGPLRKKGFSKAQFCQPWGLPSLVPAYKLTHLYYPSVVGTECSGLFYYLYIMYLQRDPVYPFAIFKLILSSSDFFLFFVNKLLAYILIIIKVDKVSYLYALIH